MRLSKFISECGVASRREAERLILSGKIQVNDHLVKELGTKIDPEKDKVRYKKSILKPPSKGVVLFHKPVGVISTMKDPEGRPAVADYLSREISSYFPVGRLDWDTSGLLLLTNDGELANRLMHPRFGVERIYEVRVKGRVETKVIKQLERGVKLFDGVIKAKVFITETDEDSTWLKVQVSEGRNRIVRRMMEHVGHRVLKLRRIQYGPFKLGRLKAGELRVLPSKDYQIIRESFIPMK